MLTRTIITAAALLAASQAGASTVQLRIDPRDLTEHEMLTRRVEELARAACNDSAMIPAANRIGCRRDIERELLAAIETERKQRAAGRVAQAR